MRWTVALGFLERSTIVGVPSGFTAQSCVKNPDSFFLFCVKDSPEGPPTANRCQLPTATNPKHLLTATNRHQPPTANCQLPNPTNHQPPTARWNEPYTVSAYISVRRTFRLGVHFSSAYIRPVVGPAECTAVHSAGRSVQSNPSAPLVNPPPPPIQYFAPTFCPAPHHLCQGGLWPPQESCDLRGVWGLAPASSEASRSKGGLAVHKQVVAGGGGGG